MNGWPFWNDMVEVRRLGTVGGNFCLVSINCFDFSPCHKWRISTSSINCSAREQKLSSEKKTLKLIHFIYEIFLISTLYIVLVIKNKPYFQTDKFAHSLTSVHIQNPWKYSVLHMNILITRQNQKLNDVQKALVLT